MTDGFLFLYSAPRLGLARHKGGIIDTHTAFWDRSTGQVNVTEPGLLLNMAL